MTIPLDERQRRWALAGGALVGAGVLVALALRTAPAEAALVSPKIAPRPTPTGTPSWFPPLWSGFRVTSSYGWRLHPTLKTLKHHDGIDLGAAVGTPVHAPLDGVVSRVDRVGDGHREANGNAVFLETGDKHRVAFLHLDRVDVSKGQTVRRGQVLGAVGATGRVTGAHLHLQVYGPDWKLQDPIEVYPADAFTPRSASSALV